MKLFVLCSVAIAVVCLHGMEKEKQEWDGKAYEQGSDFQFENAKKILAQFKLSDYKIIVDAGCGSGRVTEYMARRSFPHSMVTGFDISESQIQEAQKKLVGQPNLFLVVAIYVTLHYQ